MGCEERLRRRLPSIANHENLPTPFGPAITENRSNSKRVERWLRKSLISKHEIMSRSLPRASCDLQREFSEAWERGHSCPQLSCSKNCIDADKSVRAPPNSPHSEASQVHRLAISRNCAHDLAMSLAEVKDEVASMSDAEQRELVAYIVSLRDARDLALKRRLAEQIDDRNPERWLTLEQVTERLRALDAAEAGGLSDS